MPNMPAAHLPNSECSLSLCHWLREYIKQSKNSRYTLKRHKYFSYETSDASPKFPLKYGMHVPLPKVHDTRQ